MIVDALRTNPCFFFFLAVVPQLLSPLMFFFFFKLHHLIEVSEVCTCGCSDCPACACILFSLIKCPHLFSVWKA